MNFFWWLLKKVGSFIVEDVFKRIKKIIVKEPPPPPPPTKAPVPKRVVVVMRRSSFFGKSMLERIKEEVSHRFPHVSIGDECSSGENVKLQANKLAIVRSKKPDAVILFPVENDNLLVSEVLNLIKNKIPVIIVDRPLDDEEFLKQQPPIMPPFHVASNSHSGGHLAGVMMMEKLGHKGDIAIIAGPKNAEVSQVRLHAFIDEVSKYVPDIRIIYVEHTDWSEKEGGERAKEIISMITQGKVARVDGIFCCSDSIALGAAEAIRNPRVTIIGYDGTPEGKEAVGNSKLHGTIDVKMEEQAKRLVKELVEIFENKEKYIRYYHSESLTEPQMYP